LRASTKNLNKIGLQLHRGQLPDISDDDEVVALSDDHDSEFDGSDEEFKLPTSRYSARDVGSDDDDLSGSESLFDGASVTESSAETDDESDPEPVSRRSEGCNLQLNVPSTVRKRSADTVLESPTKRSANPPSFLMSGGAGPAENFSDDASAAESSSAAGAVVSDDASELRGLDDMDFWQ
jgi:hypothetical protein